MSRRDSAIVARHVVPRTAPPQRARPVGHGLIRTSVRTDSTIGVNESSFYALAIFTDVRGAAISSRPLPSALTPKNQATRPPKIITPAPRT
jgi:hypothetical protein